MEEVRGKVWNKFCKRNPKFLVIPFLLPNSPPPSNKFELSNLFFFNFYFFFTIHFPFSSSNSRVNKVCYRYDVLQSYYINFQNHLREPLKLATRLVYHSRQLRLCLEVLGALSRNEVCYKLFKLCLEVLRVLSRNGVCPKLSCIR